MFDLLTRLVSFKIINRYSYIMALGGLVFLLSSIFVEKILIISSIGMVMSIMGNESQYIVFLKDNNRRLKITENKKILYTARALLYSGIALTAIGIFCAVYKIILEFLRYVR